MFKVENIEDLISNFAEDKVKFYKESDKLMTNEKNMFTWCSVALYKAKEQKVNTFNSENINQLCIDLNKIFYKNIDTRNKVKKTLNIYGIKLIYIEKLKQTHINGFSFWSENNPAIALSLRHNILNSFAFTIMQEIAHINLHLQFNKEDKFIHVSGSISTTNIEIEADAYAEERLIPAETNKALIDNITTISDQAIIKFGEEHQINPAILLDRLCFHNNNYTVKTSIDKDIH
jgi:HTH-type transcriptional regulator/antitoxin HigA